MHAGPMRKDEFAYTSRERRKSYTRSRIGEEVMMIVVCAWCEQEARQEVPSKNQSQYEPLRSHGICEDHQRGLLKQIETLRMKEAVRHIPRRLSLPNAWGSRAPIAVLYL